MVRSADSSHACDSAGTLRETGTSDRDAMIEKQFIEEDGTCLCRVAFSLPKSFVAETIQLVGDFNDWNSSSHPFRCQRDGTWRITMDLECGRSYQFRYLLDGRDWINDSQADGYVSNPHGTDNCVIVTEPTPSA